MSLSTEGVIKNKPENECIEVYSYTCYTCDMFAFFPTIYQHKCKLIVSSADERGWYFISSKKGSATIEAKRANNSL